MTSSRSSALFPALTCPVQASFVTASPPAAHGMVGNGFFDRQLKKTFFWEQASALIAGERIWQKLRARGKTVAQLFWQQSLGLQADIVLSPAPIHKHHGGMIQDCFSLPTDLYPALVKYTGSPFPLRSYWGPFASAKSSAWIVRATCYVMEKIKPDIVLTYLPHLDYALQKSGTTSSASRKALAAVESWAGVLMEAAVKQGYEVLLFGDYAITDVTRAVFPNRVLYEAGFLQCRQVKNMLYPDYHTSRAFAVADHQIAHVIIQDESITQEISTLFTDLPGIDAIFDKEAQQKLAIAHERSGDLLLTAKPDAWFAYPWWQNTSQAPEYARHVDIHNKPGYDPCELFWELSPFRVSLDTSRVKGSHGLENNASISSWATTKDMSFTSGTIIDLADALRKEFSGYG